MKLPIGISDDDLRSLSALARRSRHVFAQELVKAAGVILTLDAAEEQTAEATP